MARIHELARQLRDALASQLKRAHSCYGASHSDSPASRSNSAQTLTQYRRGLSGSVIPALAADSFAAARYIPKLIVDTASFDKAA